MENYFNGFVGNREIVEYFTKNVKDNTLSHAYIFYGKSGIGKKKLALMISAALSCENKSTDSQIPCGTCKNCNKIFQNVSTDVKILDKNDKATIGIDLVRYIKNDIVSVPYDTDYKIYIIDDADLMTVQAQNAFLLTLEEPPKYAMFFLIVENLENILETIKSRSQIIRFSPLDFYEVRSYLVSNNTKAKELYNSNDTEFDSLIKENDCSIGQIFSKLDEEKTSSNIPREIIDSISNRTMALNYNSILSSFPQKRDSIIEELTVIENAFRDVLILKKSSFNKLLYYTNYEEVEEISSKLSQKILLNAIIQCEETKEKILQGSNIQLSLANFLTKIL